jgi:hypothetical protein
VDSEGRLYLGKDYADKDVKILIEEIEAVEEDPDK